MTGLLDGLVAAIVALVLNIAIVSRIRVVLPYREARFLPGSDRVVALSDESDETEFWKVAADGRALREQLTEDAVILRRGCKPSPDGKWLAWTDKMRDRRRMYLHTLERQLRR